MTIPEDFTFHPVKPGSGPAVSAPQILKRDIYHNPFVFKDIDQHAIRESKINDYSNFRDFMWNLIFKKEFSEIEKTRVIYRWLTSKNLNLIEFHDEEPGSPGKLLNDFKNGTESYARVFESLARYSGLPAVSIAGWAKGAGYSPDIPLTSTPANHSWNAVCIDGNWQLVDCHWSTRFDPSGKDSGEKLIDSYDDFYFLTEPAAMIYSHFPTVPVWQLLETPWTIMEFEDHPHLRSHFFSLGLQMLQETHGVLYTKKGLVTLTLGFTQPTSFTFKITYGDDKVTKINDVNLSHSVLQEMTDNRLTYYFRAPRAGDYYLTLFARNVADEEPKINMVFKCIGDYKIVSSEKAGSDLKPFPYCSDSSWGLDAYVNRYPMIPNDTLAIIICPSGKGQVSFEKEPGLRIYARLVNENGLSFDELKKCVTVKEEFDGARATIAVELPEEGEYGLEIFANDPKQDGETFAHFCQYLCSFLPPHDFTKLYGQVYDRQDLPIKSGSIPSSASKESTKSAEVEEPFIDEPEYKPHHESVYTVVLNPIPDDFAPAPLSDRETTDRPPLSYSYKKQFTDIGIFKNVDAHAREVAKEPHHSFRELIWHLIYGRHITNELDKLRAVFVYLCSMDLSKIHFANVEKGSPEELLVKLQQGQTTYSHVFEALCSYAGLQCHAVPGVAKGVDYQPGMHFTGDQGQHSWNVVKVQGTWQIIDCNWAARRIVGKQFAGENIHYELDEYYFLPSPQQLSYTHHPQEDLWQLLENPITLEEFERLVLIKSAFFKNGLHLISHNEAVITAVDEVTIEIGCLPAKAKMMRFTFKLTHEVYGELYHNVELTQFGMQQTVGNTSRFTLRLPEKGTYRFSIYAKDLTQAQDGDSSFSGVGEYEIVQKIVSSDSVTPFPPCAHTSWGPGDSADQYALVPLQKSAIVKTVDGVAEVRIAMEEDLRFTAKLKSFEDDDADLAPYLLTRTVGKTAIFLINAPHPGEYGLEIYANNPAIDGQTLHHVYQYLIICEELPGLAVPFPVLPSGYLGPQQAFHGLGLSVAGSADPYIVVDTGDTSVSFNTSQPVRMSSQLIYSSPPPQGDEDCTEYILQQSGDNLVTFLLKLTRPGMYKLQLFAVPYSATSESLPGVYNYLIYCRNTLVNLAPFPKQYAPWKDGCYLVEPLDGHLQPNRAIQGAASSYQHVYFSLEVPRATAVYAIIGSEWISLEEAQQGLWNGEVAMDQFWGTANKVSLVASYDNPPDQFGSLLEYSM